MNTAELLLELYGRVPLLVHDAVEGLDAGSARLAAGAGGQHDRVARVAPHAGRGPPRRRAARRRSCGRPATGPGRFGLPRSREQRLRPHAPSDVAAVRPDGAEALVDYLAPSTSAPVGPRRPRRRTTSTASSIATGTRRSRSVCASSASPTTASSTPARPPISAASSRPPTDTPTPRRSAGALRAWRGYGRAPNDSDRALLGQAVRPAQLRHGQRRRRSRRGVPRRPSR